MPKSKYEAIYRDLKEKIENKIKKIHDDEVPEISFYSISNVNTEFFNWIDEYTSKMASNCFIITR